MNEIEGKDVLLEVFSTVAGDYVPFICAQDMSISFTPELINTTTVSSGIFNTYKARRLDWEVSLSGVSAIDGNGRSVFTTLAPDMILTEMLIRMRFTDKNNATATFSGTVLLKSASVSGNQDAFSLFENGFQGSGPYTLDVVRTGPGYRVFSNAFSSQFG